MKGSSELGSGHIETTRSERTDPASVSSSIVCVGLSKDSFPISVPQSNSEVNIVALNKSSRMLSGNHVENCLQRSPFDDRYQKNYEQHFAEPYGEGCSKAISSEAEVPPFMEKVQFLVDYYSSKDFSLHQKYVNTFTLNGDGDSFGVTDHKAEERLVSTVKKTSACSIQNCESEPMLEERSVSEARNTSIG